MGENSGIQWTDATFNPWVGCTHVSPGCENCYAEINTFTRAQRAKGRELWGAPGQRHMISEAKWAEVERWERSAATAGKPTKVFCASLADVFEGRDDLDAPRARLFALIERTPNLIWQLLTKRPELVHALAPVSWRSGFPTNVWMGTTVEDRQRRSRIAWLVDLPCAVRFVSFEPLLESLGYVDLSGVAWAIFGGESGHKARPLQLAWIRDGVTNCRSFGVAPFVKQFGGKAFDDGHRFITKDGHGGDWLEWPSDMRIREFPKVAA